LLQLTGGVVYLERVQCKAENYVHTVSWVNNKQCCQYNHVIDFKIYSKDNTIFRSMCTANDSL